MMFKLKNKEFMFNVNVSNLPCWLNGALHFAEMEADGGISNYLGTSVEQSMGRLLQCPISSWPKIHQWRGQLWGLEIKQFRQEQWSRKIWYLHVVTKWISGRAIASLLLTHHMFAWFKVRPAAKGQSVVTQMQARGTMESVTRMVVTSTLTTWETSPFWSCSQLYYWYYQDFYGSYTIHHIRWNRQ